MSNGVVYDEPRLREMDEAETFSYLRGVMENGPPVRGAVLSRPDNTEAPRELPDDIFDPEALYSADFYRSEPYQMPGGKRVWVHPISVAEAMQINRQVLKEIRAAGLMETAKTEAEAKALQQDQGIELQFRGQVWQVIACARTGSAPDSPKVFLPKHAEALRSNPGLAETVQEIAGLSDRLAKGQTEAELLKEALGHFFGSMENWLGTLLSRIEQGDTISCRESLEDCAASVSALRQPGQPWNTAMVNQFSLWMILQAGEGE